MPESSGPDQSARSEVAPPLVTSKPVQRTGYAVLAAGGLVLATAFGGIAELATSQQSSGATGELASASDAGSPRGGQGALSQSDDDRTRTVDGVAVAEDAPGSSTAASRARTGSAEPTTVVRIGPDGEPTTTTITPSKPPERSSRDDSTSNTSTGGTSTGDGNSTGDGDGTSTGNSDDGDGNDTTTPGGDSTTENPGGESSTTTTTPTTSSSTVGSSSTTKSTHSTSSSTSSKQS